MSKSTKKAETPHYEAHQQADGTWDVYHRISLNEEVSCGTFPDEAAVDAFLQDSDEECREYPWEAGEGLHLVPAV
jgi:hypothetical protein